MYPLYQRFQKHFLTMGSWASLHYVSRWFSLFLTRLENLHNIGGYTTKTQPSAIAVSKQSTWILPQETSLANTKGCVSLKVQNYYGRRAAGLVHRLPFFLFVCVLSVAKLDHRFSTNRFETVTRLFASVGRHKLVIGSNDLHRAVAPIV